MNLRRVFSCKDEITDPALIQEQLAQRGVKIVDHIPNSSRFLVEVSPADEARFVEENPNWKSVPDVVTPKPRDPLRVSLNPSVER